jgi:alkanesulfonate monooxygenase SsuD/methylene tetrahydromethanopterin reductase-like flavin-dependent oxidoreductase (luciferase family)
VSDEEGVRYVLETGSIYGTPDRVSGQIEELRDAGVHHVMCQMSFGDMAHDKIIASMRRFGGHVIPAFR